MNDTDFISELESNLLQCQTFAGRIANPAMRKMALDTVGDLVMMLATMKHGGHPVDPASKKRILATLRNMKSTFASRAA